MPTAETKPGLDLDGLEAKAKAATPGPWEANDQPTHYPGMVRPCVNIYGTRLIGSAEYWDNDGHDNAAFIAAANPETILALISAARSPKPGREEIALVIRERIGTYGTFDPEIDPDTIYEASDAVLALLKTEGA